MQCMFCLGFSINALTGYMRLESALDYETSLLHSILVEVRENSTVDGELITSPHTAVVSVIIHVTDSNDNAPVFSELTYHAQVKERSQAEELIKVKDFYINTVMSM